MLNKNKQKIILIDAHALLHRAYHALPGFTSKDGKPTGAIFGFLRMILSATEEFSPSYVLACYDLPKPTFRHLAYENYKGKRKKTDEDLKIQIIESKKFCKALGIEIFEKEGFEADDLLGTLVSKIDKQKYEVIIVSGDMDVMQLIQKGVYVYTMRKGTETDLFDEKKVIEKYQIKPKQIPDYKGLVGDSSDNILGVEGIGEKTAIKLLQKYLTLENIYKQIEKNEKDLLEIISPKILEKLKNSKEEAEFSKTLASIRLDAPIELCLDKSWPEGVNLKEYTKLCDEFSLRSLRNRFDYLNTEKDTHLLGYEDDKLSININEEQIEYLKMIYSLIDSEANKVEIKNIFDKYKAKDFEDLKEKMIQELKENNLYDYFINIEEKIFFITKKMQEAGILIDQEKLRQEIDNFSTRIKKQEKKIYELAEEEFLIASPKQLSFILYEKLNLGKKIKKTATGMKSTNFEMLEKIKDEHPIVIEILNWREMSKIYNTYLLPLKDFIAADNRVHPHFISYGASTGRFSCENPNMQNLPVKSEYAKEIRNIFVAEKGHKLVSFDYSQIDLRSAAILSKDQKLIEIFKQNKDIHTSVAAQILNRKEEEIDEEDRRKAKAINFGILYGMGVSALKDAMQTDRKEAQEFYDNYKNNFKELMNYLEEVKTNTQKTGYTTTLFGRKRYIPLILSKIPFLKAQGERMAINAPIQGTSADIIKLAMIDIFAHFKEKIEKKEIRLVLQIHDELIFEIKENTLDDIYKIKDIMQNVLIKRDINFVPLVVKYEVGNKLGEI